MSPSSEEQAVHVRVGSGAGCEAEPWRLQAGQDSASKVGAGNTISIKHPPINHLPNSSTPAKTPQLQLLFFDSN